MPITPDSPDKIGQIWLNRAGAPWVQFKIVIRHQHVKNHTRKYQQSYSRLKRTYHFSCSTDHIKNNLNMYRCVDSEDQITSLYIINLIMSNKNMKQTSFIHFDVNYMMKTLLHIKI